MDHRLAYAAEKLGSAVAILARPDVPLRARVLDAYTEINPIAPDDLPLPLASRYRALRARLTCLGELGTARALAAFSDVEVASLATAIVDLRSGVEAVQ